jgi:hypothetical protein
MKVKLHYQVVLIRRGESSKTPVTVLPHEIDILTAQHGDGSIELTNAVPPVESVEIDTVDEYERLQEMYRGSNEMPNPTREVFRNLDDFESAFTEKKK